MPKFKKTLVLLLATFYCVSLFSPFTLKAQITDCDATLTPNQVDPGSSQNYTFTVTNGSAARIHWLKFTRPSANFTLTIGSASGWSISPTTSDVTFSGGSINLGVSRNFILNSVQAASVNAPSANWTVEASDTSGGSNPFTCSGSVGTQIGTPDTSAPLISNIQASNITASSATISWTTDELADSKVDYGLTGSYGSSANNASFVTSHTMDLTNLNSNTGYHFSLTSSDASNNSTSSSDNTFLTLASSIVKSPNPSSTTSGNNSTQITPSKKPTGDNSDQTIPTITFKTPFNLVYKEPPSIEGSAFDNVGVKKVEISTDGGVNWLPVTDVLGLEGKEVSFKFKPTNLADDNYLTQARVTDSSGNVGVSTTETLVIDKILPVIGPSIISVGPQIVTSVGNAIHASAHVDQKITLSTIGGPTSVIITAKSSDEKVTKTFTLTKALSSDLWSGILAFDKEGSFNLEAFAVDGAKNKTSRTLNDVTVDQSSKVVSRLSNKTISKATVTLNYFDQETASWVVWDGLSYGELNPQVTNESGEFNLFVPEGKYYLNVKANGFQDFTSEIFINSKSTNLSVQAALENQTTFKVGIFIITIPSLSLTSSKLKFNNLNEQKGSENSLIGKDLPSFEFTSTSAQKLRSLDLLGKDTVLTLLTTWDPLVEEQISQLEMLSAEEKYNLIRVNPLESLAKLKSYRKIAGYKGDFLADEKGDSLKAFGQEGLPTHIFVSKAGKVKRVISGVLTAKQLLYNLNN